MNGEGKILSHHNYQEMNIYNVPGNEWNDVLLPHNCKLKMQELSLRKPGCEKTEHYPIFSMQHTTSGINKNSKSFKMQNS